MVQETLLDVLRGVDGCRAGCEGEARSWLKTILRRRIGLLVRREGDRAAADVSLHVVRITAPEPASPLSPRIAALLADLEDALAALTPDQDRLLWMRTQTHASWREVGVALGITAAAAKRRFQRLQAAIRRRCGLDPP